MKAAGPFAALFTVFATSTAFGQHVDPDLAKAFKLDFVVPESPAFNLLQVSESNILRPSNVRELGLAASQFVSAGADFAIPRSFGVEFAPLLVLKGPTLTRADYAQAPFLYRLRVSGATSRPEDGAQPTTLAIGVRTTVIDKSDLRTNAAGEMFRKFLTDAATENVRAKTQFQDSLIAMGLDVEAAAALNDAVFAAPSGETRLERLRAGGLSDAQVRQALAIFAGLTRPDLGQLKALRDSLEDAHWNATVLDVAGSVLAAGAGETAEDLRVERWALWATAGLPVRTWGQFLVAGRLKSGRNETTDAFALEGSVAGRLYAGANELKAFVELQGAFEEDVAARLLVNSGGEFNVGRLGWVSFSAGVEFDRDSETTDLVTDLTISLALP